MPSGCCLRQHRAWTERGLSSLLERACQLTNCQATIYKPSDQRWSVMKSGGPEETNREAILEESIRDFIRDSQT